VSLIELEKEINRIITFKKQVLYHDYEFDTFSKADIKCTFRGLRQNIKYIFKKYHRDIKQKKEERKCTQIAK